MASNDFETVTDWGDYCTTQGWMTAGELRRHMNNRKIEYTGAGSILAPKSLVYKVRSEEQASSLIAEAEDSKVAANVLSVYCGNLIFDTTQIEAAFWKALYEKKVPLEFIPDYIKDILKIAY